MRYKIFIIITAIFIISVGCSTNAEKVNKDEDNKAVPVSVVQIERTTIEKVQTVTGKAKPAKSINLVSKIPGRVNKVLVNLGDNVKNGQALFIIDDKDLKLQLNQAEAALNVAKANLERTKGGSIELQSAQMDSSIKSAQINLDDASKAYEDTKALFDKGTVSKQTLDSAESRYKMAQEQYNTAKKSKELTEDKINKESLVAVEAQVKQAEASYEMAKSQLGHTVVVSPLDGIISMLDVEVGEIVSSAMPVAGIVDISAIYVDIDVMENTVNKLSVGSEYDVFIKAVKQEPFKGKVISISSDADSRTQAYLVRIEISNPGTEIKGGMISEVKLITESKDNTIAVPIECIVNDGGKKTVYIIVDNKAVRKEVLTGIQGEVYVEVTGEINEGDKVIIKGQNFVKDQSAITIVD